MAILRQSEYAPLFFFFSFSSFLKKPEFVQPISPTHTIIATIFFFSFFFFPFFFSLIGIQSGTANRNKYAPRSISSTFCISFRQMASSFRVAKSFPRRRICCMLLGLKHGEGSEEDGV